MEPTENNPSGSGSVDPAVPGGPADLAGESAGQDETTAYETTAYGSDAGEVLELDVLESDLAAVEQAITTLDEISARGVGGELAANEIAAAVSKERFGS